MFKIIHIIALDKRYIQAIVKSIVYIVNFGILKTLESIFCKNIYVEINVGVYALTFSQ